MGDHLLRLLASLAILAVLLTLMLGVSHPPLSAFAAMGSAYALLRLWRS
jgi:hypothetical protein